ncbi:MAG: DUF2817 domain-containing protein [Chloroflexota bacterium]|nr:DUF2817 domain-containing protein [Chloroflexota bacterium]MDE2897357.1 DUF2817 domain-containing protein [Chloroflexota bacterium]
MTKPASYAEITARVEAAAAAAGLKLRRYPIDGLDLDLLRVDIAAAEPEAARLAVFAGTHGDEPAPVVTVLEFLEQRLWTRSPSIAFSVFPCLNPTGYDLGTRENKDGIDLNRQFARDEVPEVRTLRAAVANDAFDTFVDAHEDPEEVGFYTYAFFSDSSWPRLIVEAVAEQGPIVSTPEADEHPVEGGVVAHGDEETRDERFREYMADGEWPLPFYFYDRGIRDFMTTETPGMIDLATRVAMQHAARDRLVDLLTASRSADA